MSNVWFVERVGGVWRTVGGQPSFQRPLSDLIFKLDLGPQRRRGGNEAPERGEGSTEGVGPHTKVFVEVVPEDVADRRFAGYFPGWYDSPYSAPEASRRLR